MNPIDGIDLWGKIDDFVTRKKTRNKLLLDHGNSSFGPTPLPFQTPALIISAGLGNS